MDVTVMLTTYKRPQILKETLESFMRLNTGDIMWEIIVIDNACDPETESMIMPYWDALPMRFYKESRAGKNIALNRFLKEAHGKLIIFTDDDVIVDPHWLKEIWEGSQRWKDAFVFGGRIEPLWPDGKMPYHYLEKHFKDAAFSIACWDIEEGLYDAGKVWGPNMAIRREIFEKGYRFNEKVGPQAGSDYIMGSETELTKKLEKDGYRSMYLPKAIVKHQIRREQLTPKWIFGRAFRYGRSYADPETAKSVSNLFGAPRFLLRQAVIYRMKQFWRKITGDLKDYMILGVKYWMIRGQIYQYKNG
jgi:glycosyltransferase involved in cell wall biosynthesis